MMLKLALLGLLALSAAAMAVMSLCLLAWIGLFPWFEVELFGRSIVLGKRRRTVTIMSSAQSVEIMLGGRQIETSASSSLNEISISHVGPLDGLTNVLGSAAQIFFPVGTRVEAA
jgi:hypothetical protein